MQEINVYLYREMVSHVPFFSSCPAVVVQAATAMVQRLAGRGQAVVAQAEAAVAISVIRGIKRKITMAFNNVRKAKKRLGKNCSSSPKCWMNPRSKNWQIN